MANEQMEFPGTWEEYEKEYGFNDSKEVYTNNARLIPSFRVKQWLDHLPSIQPKTELETWEGIHAQVTAPKGTFDKIWNEAEDNDEI